MKYNRKTKIKKAPSIFKLLGILTIVGIFTCGCINFKKDEEPITPVADINTPPVQEQTVNQAPPKAKGGAKDEDATKMVSYDITSVGRSDPFMPDGELGAYDEARNSAIAEANAKNSEIARIKNLKLKKVREADDISPYSFNLPTPPTALSSSDSYAAKITRTKVVGIMFNRNNPSAILNVDDKDYLVRQGDKIIGQEYKVVQIDPNWITVSLGSNVYSASIGEMFSKEEFDKSKNDLYNLKNRFGGRKG